MARKTKRPTAKEIQAAAVYINGAPAMSKKLRHNIALWLRRQAHMLDHNAATLTDKQFRARYYLPKPAA